MSPIAKIFEEYFPAYYEKYGARIPQQHLKAAEAIIQCRSGAHGISIFDCTDCGETHIVNNCCGNRHCPQCQQHKAEEWVFKQKKRLLPTTYFMVTFTVPSELREFARSNQRLCYTAMFKAASDTLKELLADEKRYQIDTAGFLGVLHTWASNLIYHPHLHFIVPGGGLKKDGSWKHTRTDFLLPARAISKMFRGKFYTELRKNCDMLVPQIYDKDWVVDVQNRGDGERSLKYLARYVFRVAISDSRIVSCKNGKVTFRYRPPNKVKMKRMTLDALEFIRRFLQHVLPHGFMKVRHYGYLSANPVKPLDEICRQIDSAFAEIVEAEAQKPVETKRKMKCSCGSKNLRFNIYIPAKKLEESG